ncbi:hypothetical protein OBV_12000 [Oscillibacter valericigenes Sjm18-20]|nr:hypothetical protein OBV_12000 [Oscillibacter valericigenes Sjm18-20]
MKNPSVWVRQNISEYQALVSDSSNVAYEKSAVNATTCEQVERAFELGLEPKRIYFSRPEKTEEEIQRAIGKCRLVANDWEELCQIDRIARLHLQEGFLESVGLRVVSQRYDDGNQPGIPEKTLPELAQKAKTLPAISVRGCFVQGNSSGLHGDALGRYFRESYELAKRITVILPCGMPYLCIVDGAEAACQNAAEHPETLEKFLRHAKIVAAQNQTAFYAELLLT